MRKGATNSEKGHLIAYAGEVHRTLYFRCTRCAWLAYDFEVKIGADASQVTCGRCDGQESVALENRYFSRQGAFKALNDDTN